MLKPLIIIIHACMHVHCIAMYYVVNIQDIMYGDSDTSRGTVIKLVEEKKRLCILCRQPSMAS